MNQEFDISIHIEAKTLNKPFRTPKGPKKFSVYVKNEKGNIVKVNFGDPDMEIKRDDPNRRKNFRARHNCENPGPKTKARYWSCKMWQSKKSVTDYTSGSEWDGETFWEEQKLLLSNPALANAEEMMDDQEDCEYCDSQAARPGPKIFGANAIKAGRKKEGLLQKSSGFSGNKARCKRNC